LVGAGFDKGHGLTIQIRSPFHPFPPCSPIFNDVALYLPFKLCIITKTVFNPKVINTMFNFILFGPPGSGKGTQSARLIAKYGLFHLATGDLLRSEIAKNSKLGMEAKSYMNRGQLVPDEVVIGMISNELDSHPEAQGFLFDGFPRTKAQAQALDELLQQKGTSINVVLALQVSEEELMRRLLHRGVDSGRVDDANEDIIRARIAEYHLKTAAVADYYNQFGKVIFIRGEGTVDEIFVYLCNEIDTRKREKNLFTNH
jgi:adenylate kinase